MPCFIVSCFPRVFLNQQLSNDSYSVLSAKSEMCSNSSEFVIGGTKYPQAIIFYTFRYRFLKSNNVWRNFLSDFDFKHEFDFKCYYYHYYFEKVVEKK